MFPSCVLIETATSTQMLRIYPGEKPGETILYIEYGSVKPIRNDDDREALEFGLNSLCAVLEREDFPAAESCQRGLESGVPNVVFGRNEAILQHMASQWKKSSDTAVR